MHGQHELTFGLDHFVGADHFHKTLKSHAALAKSPTRTVRTQSNHCFLAIYAACRLTWLSVTHGLNHVALRTRLYLKAVRHAFDEFQLLKAA